MASREQLTLEMTRLLAAIEISKRDFPQPSALPPASEIPYNNAGHQLLLDYSLLASMIWGAAEEIVDRCHNKRSENTERAILIAAVVGIISVLALLAMTCPPGLAAG